MAERALHTTGVFQTKNLLKRFFNKSKKKTWYETPPPTPSPLKPPKKKQEDSHRCKVLNSVLFKAVSDLLTSAQLSNELQSFSPEISKVSLARDFSSCRVFWKTSGDSQRDKIIQKALDQNGPLIRYLIMSQQTMGGVPPMVFLRDRQHAAVAEVDVLLQQADYGPDPPDSSNHRVTNEDASPSPLYGIDHELLNKKISDWWQQSKKESSQNQEVQQEQLTAFAEYKKQQIIKKRKKKAPPLDDDITPREFLLAQHDVPEPQERGPIPRKETSDESHAFKEEQAHLQELTSLEERTESYSSSVTTLVKR